MDKAVVYILMIFPCSYEWLYWTTLYWDG